MLYDVIGEHEAYIQRKIYLLRLEFGGWLRPCAVSRLQARFARDKIIKLLCLKLYILGISVPSIILADLLGNTCLLAQVQKVQVCDWWISIRLVYFVFQGLLLCDHPVSGNNRLVKFASQISLIFLILVTCKNKATSASFLRQKIHSLL